MKTLWELLIVVSVLLIFVLGISTLGNHVFTTQSLSNESVNELAVFSDLAAEYQANYSARLNDTRVDPYKETNLTDLDGFVQEYRTNKGRLDQLQDFAKLIYKAPDLVLYVVPFVDPTDLNTYADIYRILVWVLIMFLFIVGLKNGQLLPNF